MDNLSIRLKHLGGKKQEDRMQLDKLRTLKKALIYSYQGATAVLEDGREFRCLINPDKLKNDYDNKIISIPFYDICLNSEFLDLPTSLAEEPTNMKVGDIFQWKETGTYWIVYLRHLEEDAYFRAEIRQCQSIVTFDDKEYRAYIRGPVETTIRWNLKSDINWNDLNYSKIAYIKEDENTSKLKRFDIVKVDGENFQVQAVNKDTASNGILILQLKEWFTNTIEEEENKRQEEEKNKEEIIYEIIGDKEVYPYDTKSYSIDGAGGTWSLSNTKAKIIKAEDNEITILITTGKSGKVDLIYTYLSGEQVVLPITIKSL